MSSVLGQKSSVPVGERAVAERAVEAVRDRMAPGWEVTVEWSVAGSQGLRPDFVLSIQPPSGKPCSIVAAVKRTVVSRDLERVVDSLSQMVGGSDDTYPMLVARYLAVPVQRRLREKGISYADATGNFMIQTPRPPILAFGGGAKHDPWRGPGRPRGTLRGEPAAKVVRAMVDLVPPFSAPELIAASGASSGATYRVIEYLVEEGVAVRGELGRIESVDWRDLLTRWASDYGVEQPGFAHRYFQPRGPESALRQIAKCASGYAVTGSFAARRFESVAEPRLLTVYADSPIECASAIGAYPAESVTNVVIYERGLEWALARSVVEDGVVFAAASQIAVDLAIGPGREPVESNALIEWMARNEQVWRKS